MKSIKIHSMTDIITNSSTTIYTFSENSPKACREMIDAIFETFNIKMKCDDVLNLVVMMDSGYMYAEWLEHIGREVNNDLDKLIEDVKSGKVEKPEWMFDCENKFSQHGGTSLYISSKKPEYENISKLIRNFLYSTNSKECST